MSVVKAKAHRNILILLAGMKHQTITYSKECRNKYKTIVLYHWVTLLQIIWWFGIFALYLYDQSGIPDMFFVKEKGNPNWHSCNERVSYQWKNLTYQHSKSREIARHDKISY